MSIEKSFYIEMREDLDKIYNALVDEESKEWFNAKVEYMITRDKDAFYNALFEIVKKYPYKWHHLGIERFIKGRTYPGIIIYGCGHDGNLIQEVLEICGYTISCWCDSNQELWGQNLKGKKIISPTQLIERYDDYLVVIGSMGGYKYLILEHLRAIGFPLENTVILDETTSNYAIRKMQYFDLFQPDKKEVFIDAGAYNGDTIFDFLEWINGNDYTVYSLEPLKHLCKFISKRLDKNGISGVKLLNYAAWHKKEELDFLDEGDGSAIVKREGTIIVNGDAIDNLIFEDTVTFIKLDIEGAELNALKGARKTIQKNHPKLAICIYHKPLDIWEIGRYILELNPNYKLYIRHYTLTMYETILYAV